MKNIKLRYSIKVTNENRNSYRTTALIEMLKTLDGFRITNHVYPYEVKYGDFPVKLSNFLDYLTVDADALVNNYGSSTTGIVGHTEEWNLNIIEQGRIKIFGKGLLPNTYLRLFYRPYDDILVDHEFHTSRLYPSSIKANILVNGVVKPYSISNSLFKTNSYEKSILVPYAEHYPMSYPLDDLHTCILNNGDEECIKKYPFFYLDGLYSGQIILNDDYNIGDSITVMEQDFIVLAKTSSYHFLLRN